MNRSSLCAAPGLLLAASLLLAGCSGGDPENLGTYNSCADWMRAHRAGAAPAQRDELDAWLVGEALDRGYVVTDAPVAGGKSVTKDVLVRDVTVQCSTNQVLQTLENAIEATLNAMDQGQPAR